MMNANLKRTVSQLKSGKIAAAKNLKPLIRDLPSRIVERADQVLLGLSHTKDSIPALLKQTLTRIENNPNDIVGRVGRQVLEKAEIVRKQLIEKSEDSESRVSARWVPDWLKEISFTSGPSASQTMNAVPAPGEAAPLNPTADVATDVAANVSAGTVEVRPGKTGSVRAARKATGAKIPKASSARKSKSKLSAKV